MFDSLRSRTDVRGRVEVVSGLRIGAGRATEVAATDLPVIRDIYGRPFIPGSSLKGIVRTYLEGMVRTVWCGDARKGACLCTDEKEVCVTARERQELQERLPDDAQFTAELVRAHCVLCRLFGSPWIASKVKFCDALVIEDTFFECLIRDGVAIDRDTGTAAERLKFDFEVVPGGTQFDLRIVVENATEHELGLLWIGLRALGSQEIALGGMTSRGPGRVRLLGPGGEEGGPTWRRVEFVNAQEDTLLDALLGKFEEVGQQLNGQLDTWAREALAKLRKGEALSCTE